jgi:hypothetical protein
MDHFRIDSFVAQEYSYASITIKKEKGKELNKNKNTKLIFIYWAKIILKKRFCPYTNSDCKQRGNKH